MKLKQKTITSFVRLYRTLPFKPFSSFFRILYYRFLKSSPENRTLIKNVDGINYELDLTEVIDSAIFYSQTREPDTSKAISRLCRPGDVVFDIGANVGSHTLPIAKIIGSSGKVYAFEPVPWALDKLKRNLSLNDFENVEIVPIALSDVTKKNQEFSLRASFQNGNASPVNPDGKLNDNWWSHCQKVHVDLDTVDHFILENGLANPDLIKLDVDGFEVKVLRGAVNLLRESSPTIIMEIAPSWLLSRGDDVNDLLEVLEGTGYEFYHERTFNKLGDIRQILGDLKSGAGINVIASKNSV